MEQCGPKPSAPSRLLARPGSVDEVSSRCPCALGPRFSPTFGSEWWVNPFFIHEIARLPVADGAAAMADGAAAIADGAATALSPPRRIRDATRCGRHGHSGAGGVHQPL
jgi:X-X-X-Leu-X-X-Gly heptad repeat protein